MKRAVLVRGREIRIFTCDKNKIQLDQNYSQSHMISQLNFAIVTTPNKTIPSQRSMVVDIIETLPRIISVYLSLSVLIQVSDFSKYLQVSISHSGTNICNSLRTIHIHKMFLSWLSQISVAARILNSHIIGHTHCLNIIRSWSGYFYETHWIDFAFKSTQHE